MIEDPTLGNRNTLKRLSPNIDPWGTPIVILRQFDVFPFKIMLCWLSEEKEGRGRRKINENRKKEKITKRWKSEGMKWSVNHYEERDRDEKKLDEWWKNR